MISTQPSSEIKCVKNTKYNSSYTYDGSGLVALPQNSSLAPQLITAQIESEHALNVSPGDWHFGDEGNTLAMQALAKALAKNQHPKK